MQAYKEGVGTSGRSRRHGVLVFFFWVILILSQATFSFSKHGVKTSTGTTTGRLLLNRSVQPPRRARYPHKVSFHAPSSTPSEVHDQFVGVHGDPDSLYGDDKRIVHTAMVRMMIGKETEEASVNALISFAVLFFLISSVPLSVQIHCVFN